MKKRILVLGCKNFPAFSSKKIISGGMEVYVTDLLSQLKTKYDFTIISGYSPVSDGIKVLSVPLFGGFALQPISLLFFTFFISVWTALFGKRPDLVNAQTPLSGLVALLLKKIFRIPYVVTVHIFASDKDHVGTFSGLYGAIERVVLLNADRVVAAGYRLKRFLDERYQFAEGRVVVINPGMDLYDQEITGCSDKIKDEFKDGSFKILYIGRLIEENGVTDLLEAMKILKDRPIRLLVAGNGNLEGMIREYITREGLEARIKLLGVVKGADKLFLLKNSDLSIRTSYHEVFPVAYLESIAFGVPVIATPVGDTEYLAEKTGAIRIVPMHAPERAAEAIKERMRSGKIAKETVEQCREFIRSISWEKQAAKTAGLFDEYLS